MGNLEMTGKILYKDESYMIQGAVFEVYKAMGCGFLEAVYQECLAYELRQRHIPFYEQKEMRIVYKGKSLSTFYKADFICFDAIILELKAVSAITDDHRAQLFNYLKATGYRLGLLINFGHYPKVQIERIAK